jgi:hypothetical protein
LSAWDGATGRLLHSIDLPPYNNTLPTRRFSRDGRYAVTFEGDYNDLQIVVWDVAAHRRLHTLRPPGANQSLTCALAPDSSVLAAWLPAKETLVRLWHLASGREIGFFPERKAGWHGQLSFTPDGKMLLVAGKRTAGYDVTTGKELFSWRMEPVKDNSGLKVQLVGQPVNEDERIAWRALAVSPDATLAACILNAGMGRAPLENRIVLCEAKTGRVVRRWNDSGKPSRWGEQLCFALDGRLLASAGRRGTGRRADRRGQGRVCPPGSRTNTVTGIRSRGWPRLSRIGGALGRAGVCVGGCNEPATML